MSLKLNLILILLLYVLFTVFIKTQGILFTWIILEWYCCVVCDKSVACHYSTTTCRSRPLEGSIGHCGLAKYKPMFTWRENWGCWKICWCKPWQTATTKTIFSRTSKEISYAFAVKHITRRVTIAVLISVMRGSTVMTILKAQVI